MKEKKIIKTFFMILCILGIYSYIPTEAKTTCTTQEKNNLIQLAYNVKFDYELSDDQASGEGKRYYKITISNLTKDVYVAYDVGIYTYDEKSTTPGVVTIGSLFSSNETYYFKMYASGETKCSGQFLTTKMLRLPVYNIYSEKEACKKYPNFNLCDKNYAGNITDEQFNKELKNYKDSLVVGEEEKQTKKEMSIVKKIITLYTENLKISLPMTALLILVIVILIRKIIKRQKRTKIDI